MITTDPFTRVERLLWFVLESHPGFTSRVPPGNRIKLCESEPSAEKAKAQPQASDLPEVMVVPAGGQGEQSRTSSGEGFEQLYEIRVSTAYLQSQGNNAANELQRGIGPLKWEIIRAFRHRSDVYASHPFVKRITSIPVVDQYPGNNATRGPGWESVLTLSVLMYWPHLELQTWL